MEKQEKRISRVERNSKKYKNSKINTIQENEYVNNSSYQANNDDFINTSKVRVRRTERNKRKKREDSLIGNLRNKKEKVIEDKNIKIAAIGLIIAGLLIILLGLTIYFKSYFYFGTSINCLNVSGKSVEDVEKEFRSNIADYTLNISVGDNIHQELWGIDIDLVYDKNKKVK